MIARQALCPSCGILLDVPAGKSDCFVRCGACQHRFRLPKIPITEDAVTDWLAEGQKQEQQKMDIVKPQQDSARTAVLPAITDAIRIVKADRTGVLFEFPCSRLAEQSFRCAVPRRCLRCGTRTHLNARLIIYSTHLTDGSGERQIPESSVTVQADDLATLTEEELLQRLPRIKNMPQPADLPMPYWICDQCEPEGMIAGQVRFTDKPGVGICRLWIGQLRRAEEFLGRAGAKNTPDHASLVRLISALPEEPWDSVPLSVQRNIAKWFKPSGGEQFVAYIPNVALNRQQEGSEGLVVSTFRVVFHTKDYHRESLSRDPLELTEAFQGGSPFLQIKSPSWHLKRVTVDRDDIPRLRNALNRAKFQTSWR